MEYHFCTYFDSNYLNRGLALYRSLSQHCGSFRLYVLCLDPETYEALSTLDLPGVELIRLEQFEEGDVELMAAKANRSRVEYYFTCTPSLPLYILRHYPAVDLITYLDADLYFFADPEPIFREMASGSIGIIEHRFPPGFERLLKNGRYNVGWISFRRDDAGLACLSWWRERCNEWCHDWVEGDRFADQKYLDKWPTLFERVVVIKHKGANVAPWNIANYDVSVNDKTPMVDEQPIIFFHFHGLKRLAGQLYDTGLSPYQVQLSSVLKNQVYIPYLCAVLSDDSDVTRKMNRKKKSGLARGKAHGDPLGRMLNKVRRFMHLLSVLARGTFVSLPRPS